MEFFGGDVLFAEPRGSEFCCEGDGMRVYD